MSNWKKIHMNQRKNVEEFCNNNQGRISCDTSAMFWRDNDYVCVSHFISKFVDEKKVDS